MLKKKTSEGYLQEMATHYHYRQIGQVETVVIRKVPSTEYLQREYLVRQHV